MRWAERIRDALETDRFVLYEQPILSLADARVDRAELLIRMRPDDPDDELVAPAAFLPIAERYGHIRAIDRWVVREAIVLLSERQAAGNRVGAEVNLSGDSISDASVVDYIVSEIGNAGIDPARLTFEVTETAAIGNLDRARRLASQLAALGCAFALDDFGAGFGSFAYLKHLPLDIIKIDGQFIRGLPSSSADQVTVSAMVDIAKGLGKQTVAEFVEDEATLELLRRLGVDRAQGYHIGRPRPASRNPAF
jgi:EAL domain-containing protein (putative c-di-GMP-specific phosphodiesterase class I)